MGASLRHLLRHDSQPAARSGRDQSATRQPRRGHLETYAISNLLPGTTYYWRIVSKTWAASRDPSLVMSGPVWSFTTAGAPPPPPPGGTRATTPYGGTPAAIPGIIQVENFDVNGQSAAYFDTDAGRAGAPYRTTNVDIGPTADANSNGYYVGWTRVGEWLVYTVNVTQTRTYNLTVRVANVGSGAKFRVDVDGAQGPQNPDRLPAGGTSGASRPRSHSRSRRGHTRSACGWTTRTPGQPESATSAI